VKRPLHAVAWTVAALSWALIATTPADATWTATGVACNVALVVALLHPRNTRPRRTRNRRRTHR
jgi:hypothetical protein